MRDKLSHLRSLNLITASFSYIHIYPGNFKENVNLERNDLGYATDLCITELAMMLYEKCHFVDNEN